jgi:ATP-dependent RNA helicase DeaD
VERPETRPEKPQERAAARGDRRETSTDAADAGLTAKRYKPRHTTAQKAAQKTGRSAAPAGKPGTPAGKPSSKKNRARALEAKGRPGGKGGSAPPKRRPPRAD